MITCALGAVLALSALFAQQRSLTFSDYDRFGEIGDEAISADGNWVGYTCSRPRATDTLMLCNLGSGVNAAIPGACGIGFSADSKWAAYRKDGATMLRDLATGKENSLPAAKSFIFAGKRPVLLLLGPDKVLTVCRPAEGSIERYGSVSEYSVNATGSKAAFAAQDPKDSSGGLYLLDLESGQERPLEESRETYSKLVWNASGDVLTCLKGTVPDGGRYRANSVLVFALKGKETARMEYDPQKDEGFPKGFVISDFYAPSASADLSVAFFGIKEQEERLPMPAQGVADVDVWHWKDGEYVQGIQSRFERYWPTTFLSAATLKEGRFVKICDDSLPSGEVSPDGSWVVAGSYKLIANEELDIYDPKYPSYDYKYFRVDPKTGERRRIEISHAREMGFSPDGRNCIFWKDKAFWNYIPQSDRLLELTEGSDGEFEQQELDMLVKEPYGIAGYTKDGKGILLHSRYDIYCQPLDGGKAVDLTGGYGKKNDIIFNYIYFDWQGKRNEFGDPIHLERSLIDLTKPMLLYGVGKDTKKEGVFLLEKGKLKEMAYSDNHYEGIRDIPNYYSPMPPRFSKAEEADRYVFKRESSRESPDLYVTDLHFKSTRRISDINPFVGKFKWYHNVLLDYSDSTSGRGALHGALLVPDSYKPGDRYPMVVLEYGLPYSVRVNCFERPVFSSPEPEAAMYASNGYLVLLPDVRFKGGSSTADFLECVSAAVDKVTAMGYCDPSRIGLFGHSFGGQGANYIVTHCDKFACAVSASGVSDLASYFNEQRSGEGSNNHHYAIWGQMRFGKNLYDDFPFFIANSPVFSARQMNTPLLLIHGMKDNTIEWQQAMEFYNGLMFNKKNVILLAYPNESHVLSKYPDQLDVHTRMFQFYNHYLKGAEAPEWMENGVPYLKKNALKYQ